MNRAFLLFTFSFLLFSNVIHSQLTGCTDLKALNYEASAIDNDGSCLYTSDTINPTSSFILQNAVSETSGLILWNHQLWTHNDSGGSNKIYALDTLNGDIVHSVPLNGTENMDWEEISQDNEYIYIGDFGNNISGNRTDLKILRVAKISIIENNPVIDTINFSYPDQINFTPLGVNSTDFDCEAFIVSEDSIYLFTKQWVSEKTNVYSLPKIPGTYVADFKSTIDVQGLVTGSVYLDSRNIIALCGYSNEMRPFIYLLYDFDDFDFSLANKRKIVLFLQFHQVEAITSTNGLKYYLSNESYAQLFIKPKLHIFDLTEYLDNHLLSTLGVSEREMDNNFMVYPVPSNDFITVKNADFYPIENYTLINTLGQVVLSGQWAKENQNIDISALPNGMYVLKMGKNKKQTMKVIKN